MLQPSLGLEKKIASKFMADIRGCIKISYWCNIYYLYVAATFRVRKLLQNLWLNYEPVSRILIDTISITYMLQPFLGLENCFKFYGKYKIFLMPVYMIYFYSKRFRFAPSFNNLPKKSQWQSLVATKFYESDVRSNIKYKELLSTDLANSHD